MSDEHVVFADGTTLSPQEVMMVAKQRASVAVSENAWPAIHAARGVVDRIVSTGETVYGINTGFGALVQERISTGDLAQLQLNLVRSHATALGEYMSVEAVRAMMLIRLNSLCKGHSGIHPDCIHQLVDYLNQSVHPAVPRIGSLGASGDLAPLSHLALALIGEGTVLEDGDVRPTSDALFDKGLAPVELTAKDGLSLINGTSQMTAYSALAQQELSELLILSDVVLAASMDARSCSLTPSREEVHQARPHPGQALVAQRLRAILSGSEILDSHEDCDRVQDPYSFRCAPQVHGAVYESYMRLSDMLYREINSATDNPLIFPEPDNPGTHEVVSQGNFHG
ncbi:MAG TPA: aromatic amino acid lyase, partial [Candidatus Poseidoniales archaeon]